MPQSAQTYKSHAKIVPLFHYVVLPLLTANMVVAARPAMQSPDARTIIAFTTAVALVMLAFFARIFALRVQDRLIRLEMRLKLRELMPSSLSPQIAQLTAGQMVALRFASDEELPELVNAVLRDNITDRKTIKSMIKTWVPDHARM